MANFMNDPRANMISDNGIFLDWCGDDTRYYYNGSYVDLCGMSPEDYMKNWFCCDSEGGGGSDSRINAVILTQKLTTDEYGNDAVEIIATASKPVTSELTVTITVEYINEETDEIATEDVDVIIPVGGTKGKLMFAKPSITITSASASPESDDKYDYVTSGNISPVIGCLFHGVYPSNGSDEGITVGLENIINNVTYLSDNVYNAIVEIPYTYVSGKITNDVIKENTKDMVFALDADIDKFTITDPNGVSYMEYLSNVIKTISVQAPDENGNLVSAFYKVYRMKNEQFVNIGTKKTGSPIPFDIKLKIQ